MSYLLTFLAGMLFSIAAVLFALGAPMEALKYLSGVTGSLLWAWLIHKPDTP